MEQAKWKIAKVLGGVILPILGIIFPAIFWYYDNSRALVVKLTSSVPLQPAKIQSLSAVVVMIDGAPVESAYLSTIEILNSGSKPILASDFDAPMALNFGKAKLKRATVEKSDPSDLLPQISVKDDQVLLHPLLLNAGDKIAISVLTAVNAPTLSVRARIASIPRIGLEIGQSDAPGQGDQSFWRGVFRAALSFLGLLMYFYLAAYIISHWALNGWPPTLSLILIAMVLASSSAAMFTDAARVFPFLREYRIAAILLMMIPGTLVMAAAKRHVRRNFGSGPKYHRAPRHETNDWRHP